MVGKRILHLHYRLMRRWDRSKYLSHRIATRHTPRDVDPTRLSEFFGGDRIGSSTSLLVLPDAHRTSRAFWLDLWRAVVDERRSDLRMVGLERGMVDGARDLTT